MKSNNFHVIVLLIVTILVTYFTPIPFLGLNIFDYEFHLNKLYNVLYIALIVTITDLILNIEHFTTTNFVTWLFILIIFTVILYYFIKEQIFINKKSYFESLIHASELDIKMSEKMLVHNDLDEKTKQSIRKILYNKKNELNELNSLINE